MRLTWRATLIPAQPDPGRARDADLSDDGLRLRGCRSRGGAVQSPGLRQHLFAHHEPDERGARRAHRGARRRTRGACGRFRTCGAVDRVPHADGTGRRNRRRAPALWRLDQPVQPGLREVRLAREMGRRAQSGLVPRGADAEDEGDLHREHRQSRRHRHRYRSDRRRGKRSRRAADRRQHAGLALSHPSARMGRRHRRAFGHEIPRRPRQFDGGPDRRRRQVRLGQRRQISHAVGALPVLSRHAAVGDVRRHGVRHRLPRAGPARSRALRCRP
jgi:hypothetical protein